MLKVGCNILGGVLFCTFQIFISNGLQLNRQKKIEFNSDLVLGVLLSYIHILDNEFVRLIYINTLDNAVSSLK